MKPKTRFLKMFYKLPEEARSKLVFNAYGNNPMSLAVICVEVRNDTDLGKLCLCALGYSNALTGKSDVNAEMQKEAVDER